MLIMNNSLSAPLSGREHSPQLDEEEYVCVCVYVVVVVFERFFGVGAGGQELCL
jgi:hypothetical protein